MNSEAHSSHVKSQIKRVSIGATLAAAVLWGAWLISNGQHAESAGTAQDRDSMQPAPSDVLQVDVSGVRSDLGFVIGTLCRKGELFPSKCSLKARSKATDGVVSLDFKGLSKGEYALAIYHDENDNSILELGTEGIGFSNNANLARAPPEFDASSIDVDGVTRIRVRIRYSI